MRLELCLEGRRPGAWLASSGWLCLAGWLDLAGWLACASWPSSGSFRSGPRPHTKTHYRQYVRYWTSFFEGYKTRQDNPKEMRIQGKSIAKNNATGGSGGSDQGVETNR